MSNSPLVTYTKISPNKTSPRNHDIDTVTIHCVVGQCTAEGLGDWFANPERQASSNYGIDRDGRIALFVDEADRSWCTSSRDNDHRAITIEVASDTKPPYAVNYAAYVSLIQLLVDICKRNNIKKLLWKNDKSLIGQVDQQNMTVHRWFANTACPGDYLLERYDDIAAEVNKKLGITEEHVESEKTYHVHIGHYSNKAEAQAQLAKAKAAGFTDAHIMVGEAEHECELPWEPEVGDIVMFNGNAHYVSADADKAVSCSEGKAVITRIHQLGKSKHPYHLVKVGKAGPHGWVDAGSFTKI